MEEKKEESKSEGYTPRTFLEIARSTGVSEEKISKIFRFLLPDRLDGRVGSSTRVVNLMDFLLREGILEEEFFNLCQHESFSSTLYRFSYYKYILPNISKIMLGVCTKTLRSRDPKDARSIYQLMEAFIPELKRDSGAIEEHRHIHLSSMDKSRLLEEVDLMVRKVKELKMKAYPTLEGVTIRNTNGSSGSSGR